VRMTGAKDEELIATNRKAGFEYHIEQKWEAGLQLTGTEIKSVRNKQVNINDAWCTFINGELFVKGMHIAVYKEGSVFNHQEKRDRKLLLKKQELRKLSAKVKEKGYTIIPLRVYINGRGYAKLEIALAKGKKSFDKRETIKKRDTEKELRRLEKSFSRK
jgi:SsrA-binding protein